MTTSATKYDELNNAGQGFDPSAEIGGWTLLRAAETTDDVSEYVDEDGQLVLVGTDGSGDEDSRWAVRVEHEGLPTGDEVAVWRASLRPAVTE